MIKYLGSEVINIRDSPFKHWDKVDFINWFIEKYSKIDGHHHRSWIVDQCKRIYDGCEIIITKGEWSNGHVEYFISTGEESEEYLTFREELKREGSSWEEGIAP